MRIVQDEAEAIEVRIDAYLDGLLSPAEAREVERSLIDPAVARALGEALALRELLTTAADEVTPHGLADRIIGAVGVAEAPSSGSGRAGADDVEAADGQGSPTRAALYGASTVKYALGPLSLLGAANADEEEEAPRRRWWHRALGLGRRR
ncbi:MAG: zf-HC2 domain-containing protein [Deltaproteobacteria bacterium]|nr:zf-HC2 domain-containing protein [Deltaproteobacteria bacterium]